MNRSDLGCYFIKNNEIYEAIAYASEPTLELKNIRTGQKEVVVIGSLVSEEYNKLFYIPATNKGYNLDKIEPVRNINFGEK
jgi:hypothetical protein